MPIGEARIDQRAALVVSFAMPDANPIPLRGMVDTGSGVSIMTFSAFNRVSLQTNVALQPLRSDLYCGNGRTIKKPLELRSVCASNLVDMNSKPIS